MKPINKFIFAFYLLLSIVLLLYAIKRQTTTDSAIFCAYGRIFVEFEDGWNRWGTMLLDRDGKTIPCDDNKFGTISNGNQEKERYDKSI